MSAAGQVALQDQWEADALAAVRLAVRMLAELIAGGFGAELAQSMVYRWWGDMYPSGHLCDFEDDE